MNEIEMLITQFIGNSKESFIYVNGQQDILLLGVTFVVIIALAMMLTFYTLKKIAFNLFLGYLFVFAAKYALHVSVTTDYLMFGLMAFFGPLPVIVAVLWHYFM